MLDPSLRIAVVAAALACAACQPSSERQAAAAKDTIERFCTDCHNDAERTADLTLQHASLTDVAAHADVWEKVVRKLRGNMMPPTGEPLLVPQVGVGGDEDLEALTLGGIEQIAVLEGRPAALVGGLNPMPDQVTT